MSEPPTTAVPDTRTQSLPFWLCAFFLLCALFWNPGIFNKPKVVRELPLFTIGALTFLAGGIILTAPLREIRRMPKFMLVAGSALGLLILGHLLLPSTGLHLAGVGESLWWIAIPALTCCHYHSFRKLLPIYILTVGGYSFLYSFIRILVDHWNTGITGNYNWTCALFVMTMIFFGWFICECLRRTKSAGLRILFLILGIAGELLLLWEPLRIGSKGSVAAAVLTALLFFFLRSGEKIRRACVFLGLVVLLAVSLWAMRHTDSIGRFFTEDGRVLLWEYGINLIADHPLFGVGQNAYTNEFLRCRTADYFMLSNPATLTNHPHNHLLFMAGSWGLTGLILWGILLFAPLAAMVRKYYRHEAVDPLETACFLTVCYAVLHGSLDIIMFSMPTGLIALMCLGMLWHNLIVPDQPAAGRGNRAMLIFTAAGLLLAALVAWTALHANLQMRRTYDDKLTVGEIVRTARDCPGEYHPNFAMLLYLLKRRETGAALAVSEVMLKSHTPNYPGLHMGRGNALMLQKRFAEALENYRIEAELFPLALRPVYNMIVAARFMNNFALAAKLETELRERMRIRGNDDRDLKIILLGRKGDQYDVRAGEKPQQ